MCVEFSGAHPPVQESLGPRALIEPQRIQVTEVIKPITLGGVSKSAAPVLVLGHLRVLPSAQIKELLMLRLGGMCKEAEAVPLLPLDPSLLPNTAPL